MKNIESGRRRFAIGALGVVGFGVTTAAHAPTPVKGVTYRIKIETKLLNFGFGGGAGGGGNPDAGGAGGAGGFGGGFGGGIGQLVRVAVAGDRAKIEFQLGNPPGSSITDYYLVLLDSNK